MELADAHRLKLATVSGDVDLSTAQGRLVARLKGAVARHEIDQIKARQAPQAPAEGRAGYSALAPGVRLPRRHPPTGPEDGAVGEASLCGGVGRRQPRRCVPHVERAEAFTLNGKPWTHAQMSKFLRKPRNAGLRAHNGEIIGKGNWPALVDESTWRAAQAVLNAPGGAGAQVGV